jgi:hypothetical protein
MCRRSLILLCSLGCCLFAQKYTGPRPPKPDIPYLQHADNLVEPEIGEAKEETRKDDNVAIVSGSTSPVTTPLASPVFLLQADKLNADKMELYRLESKNGNREIVLVHKKKPVARPIRLKVSQVSSDNLYRIEADESLQPGEYSLTPSGSDQVFCFRII